VLVKRRTEKPFAVLLLDVDEFKHVNDSLGHDAGDALLCAFAERLKEAVRGGDVVARLGGDEFAVLLTEIDGPEDVEAFADRLFAMLREPVVHDQKTIECRASIGGSLVPAQGSSGSDLLKNADLALYSAKSTGRGVLKLYEPAMRAELHRRQAMLALGRRILDEDLVSPFYQPKVDLRTGAITGFEALLRWRDPKAGVQLPATIEACFEDVNLAAEISERMIERVLGDLRRWLRDGIDFGHVAVNAAAAEFRSGRFAEHLLSRLAAVGIPPERLQIEVTETVFLGRGAEHVERALQTLSASGIRIALDDFGTGYASMSNLKRFPVDALKIDRSFVHELQLNPEDGAIVDAVISLGRSLNMEVVAEGIETAAQRDFLTALGCTTGQGFLYGRATPAVEVPAYLKAAAARIVPPVGSAHRVSLSSARGIGRAPPQAASRSFS
jgi:diguanylate cyclase (GGDEF)-like protein